MKYCKQIGNLLEDAKSEIKSKGKITGILKFGCIETTMALKAPDILNYFHERCPDVDLEFISAMRNRLINDVMDYKLDAAFISVPIYSKAFAQIKVKEEQLVINKTAHKDCCLW